MAEKSGGTADLSELGERLKKIKESAGFSYTAGGGDLFSQPSGKEGVSGAVDPNVGVAKVVNDVHEDGAARVSSLHGMSSGVYEAKIQPPMSYAAAVSSFKSSEKVMLRVLHNTEVVDGSDVVIPLPAIKETSAKFANTLYGYFVGKRLAYPVVEQFVKNAWVKYGFRRSMMNGKGFFFFQFESKEGIDRVLEDGPWLIRNVPIFLDVWTPSVNLTKEGVKAVPLWVKLLDVPLVAFSEDGLSLLTTKIGKPKRLDGHTSDMCRDLWGRSSYARALVEVSSEKELKEELVVAIPSVDGEGFVKERVKIEYEWRPPRCGTCCVFGHVDSKCPKLVVANIQKPYTAANNSQTGYQLVNKFKEANKARFPIKQNPKLIYRPVDPKKK